MIRQRINLEIFFEWKVHVSRHASRQLRFARIGRLVAINVIIILLILIAFEIYLRQHQSYIIEQNANWLQRIVFVESSPGWLLWSTPDGRRLIPNAHVIIRNHYLSNRDIIMDINSMGFRDDEISEIKDDDEIRILVLGDSITWGDYIQADEVYVERIEDYLQKWLSDKVIEVINAGVEDIGLKEEIDILEEKGLSIEPDVVVVAFYLNDSRPPWGFLGELGRYGFFRRYSVLAQTIYGKLVLKKWIRKKGKDRFGWLGAVDKLPWQKDRQAFLRLAYLAEYDWGASWKDESWQIIERQLERLKTHQERYGFDVVIVAFPVSYQVYSEFIEATPQINLQQRANGLGFHYLDLLPLLRKHNNAELFYDQCHLRPKANDIVGKAIGEFLKEEVLSTDGI